MCWNMNEYTVLVFSVVILISSAIMATMFILLWYAHMRTNDIELCYTAYINDYKLCLKKFSNAVIIIMCNPIHQGPAANAHKGGANVWLHKLYKFFEF